MFVRTARLASLTLTITALSLVGPSIALAQYAAEVNTDSPTAYWRLGEASGTIAGDSSTNSLDGTYTNSPNLGSPGLIRNDPDTAVGFDGVDDYVAVSNNTLINTDGTGYPNKTIELWFNADTLPAGTDHQVLYEQGGTTNGLNVYTYQNEVYVGVWGNNGPNGWVSAPVQTGRDYHVALTYDGGGGDNTGTLIGYLNGHAFSTSNGRLENVPSHNGDVNIGSRQDTRFQDSADSPGSNTDFFDGVLDEVALYNSTLTGTRVRAHNVAASDYAQAVLGDDPVAYFRAGTNNFAETNPSGLGSAVDINNVSGSPDLFAASLLPGDAASSAVRFNGGNDGMQVPNNPAINTSNVEQRTIELWFNADDVNSRQVLFEEGGTTKGINAYVEGGRVHVGTWNNEGIDQLKFLDAAISKGKTYHLSLAIDATGDNAMTAFLNGTAIGGFDGVAVVGNHAGDIGIGRMFNDTRIDDGSATGFAHNAEGLSFDGVIDEVAIYNTPHLAHQARGHIAAAGGTNNAYEQQVFSDDPIAAWQLGESSGELAVNVATDGSGMGHAINGVNAGAGLQTNANRLIVNGDNDAYRFDGREPDNDPARVAIPDNTDYNRNNAFSKRTIEANFYLEGTGDGTENRRVIYEEGGGTRGLSMFIRENNDGSYALVVGGWNASDDDGAGSSWGGDNSKFIETPISLQNPYQVQLVLDGDIDGANNPTGTLRAYINGTLFGEVAGVGRMHPHDPAQIGARESSVRFESGIAGGGSDPNGNAFLGIIDDVNAYGSAFDDATADDHFSAAQPYMNQVLDADPVAYWRLGENGFGGNNIAGNIAVQRNGSGAGVGSAADGTYGSAVDRLGFEQGLVAHDPNGAAQFNGSLDSTISVNDVNEINTSTQSQRTIELIFNADATTDRQVLYEEGGATNGFNIYIENGELIVGAWKHSGDNYDFYSSINILADTDYHVAMVFDADDDYFAGYLNGLEFDPMNVTLTDMPSHTADIGIGGMLNDSRFQDGSGTQTGLGDDYFFSGIIDEVAVFNTALAGAVILDHFQATGIPTPAALPAGLLLLGLATWRRR